MSADEFKNIFMPIHQKMYRVAFRMLEDKQLAQDIVQESLVKLWDKRQMLDTVDNCEAYAITIVKNTSYDHIRKPKRVTEIYDTNFIDEKSVIADIEVKDELIKIKNIIDELPEPQRKIMILKHWEEYTDKEISETTGVSEGNIRVILSRTRRMIKEHFAKVANYENK